EVCSQIDVLIAEALKDFGASRLWLEIKAAYSQPHRRYHTLSHLKRMFCAYGKIENTFSYPRSVRLAIWFHDIVYETDARYPYNEVASANRMRELITRFAPFLYSQRENGLCVVEVATELILATKAHELSSEFLKRSEALF